jgi:CBS domain-containing protein
MQVRDVLKSKSRGVIKIGCEATVAEAVGRLVEHNIGSLPVVDDAEHLVGIFTERDVLRGVDRGCERYLKAQIRDVMTHDPVTCVPEDNVHDVMGKMSTHRVGQLPVVDGDAVVGLVSVGDVIMLLYEKVDAENRHLLEYLYGPG